MQNHGLMTPPPSPDQSTSPFHYRRTPPTPESRIGTFLGRYLELKTILGTGAYGVVYSAFDHLTHIWYAVKTLSKHNANGEPLDKRQREFQNKEIRLHYMASSHPNIVSVLKIVDDPDCTYVVLDFCPEGDLFSNITERCRYLGNDDLVRSVFLQILDAVEHCHRLGIYHRDLKPENILVSNAGTQVLLADFGLATATPVSEDHGCGSTFYMSPECLDQSRNASYRCAPNDVWSLGVILVNLVCGRNPWKQASVEDSTYKAFIENRDFLKTILPLSHDLNVILGKIFETDAEKRINVSQLKQWIHQCPSFYEPVAPTQKSSLPSPPASPLSYTETEDHFDASTDDGSVSDAGSLTGSCSTLSDTDSEVSEMEFEVHCDDFQEEGYVSGDESLATTEKVPIRSRRDSGYMTSNEAFTTTRPIAQTANVPTYVLPQQDLTNPFGVVKAVQSPMSQAWNPNWNGNPYEQQYQQAHAVPNAHRQGYYYTPQYGQAVWV